MESQTKIILTVVILVALALAGGMYYRSQQMIDAINAPKNDEVVCTDDAKICPDGSSVGRVAPDCEFAACPLTKPIVLPPTTTPPSNEPVACTQDAKQCPDGSYVGRSGPNCEFVCPSGIGTY